MDLAYHIYTQCKLLIQYAFGITEPDMIDFVRNEQNLAVHNCEFSEMFRYYEVFLIIKLFKTNKNPNIKKTFI
jgi:hypothetical protein